MKTLKKILCVVMSILMAFSVAVVAGAEGEAEAAEDTAVGFTAEDFLKVKGTKIINQKGEKITLKGVNLGGWLVREDWLCPDKKPSDGSIYDGIYVYDTLQERFDNEKAQELLETYYDNWITEWDLDQIKSLGFNCVRVPFWYRNFYHDDKGTKILNDNGEWDFYYLDWVVEECSKREIYVILDMHGAVGSQSDAPHSGHAFDGAQLTTNAEYQRLTNELWQAIATRFKGNPAVAMYDLLNEPMCDVETTEINRRIQNEKMYTRLYDAVREVDPDHIITVEAIWTALALPHAFIKGWKNVVYQVHFYQNNDFIFTFFCLLTRMYHFDVPLMMGEFYPHQKTTWKNCFETMNNLGIHWMLWTYKASGHGATSDWCLYRHEDGYWEAQIETGDENQIIRSWGEHVQTKDHFEDTGHYENNVKAYL